MLPLFLTIDSWAKNVIKLIVQNVKAWASRKITECVGNKLNMSHMASMVTNHHCNHKSNLIRKIQEKCAKMMCLTKFMKVFYFTVDCVWNHIFEGYQEYIREFWFYLFRSYSSNKMTSVKFIVIHSVVWRDTKTVLVFGFLVRKLSIVIQYKWFRNHKFQLLLYCEVLVIWHQKNFAFIGLNLPHKHHMYNHSKIFKLNCPKT